MKKEDCKCERHIFKKIFWGAIAAAAFMKAIEGPNHMSKRRCCKKNKNKIIYIYK